MFYQYSSVLELSEIMSHTSVQCLLNAWERWAAAWEPHEHRDPMLINVLCTTCYLMFKH